MRQHAEVEVSETLGVRGARRDEPRRPRTVATTVARLGATIGPTTEPRIALRRPEMGLEMVPLRDLAASVLFACCRACCTAERMAEVASRRDASCRTDASCITSWLNSSACAATAEGPRGGRGTRRG